MFDLFLFLLFDLRRSMIVATVRVASDAQPIGLPECVRAGSQTLYV